MNKAKSPKRKSVLSPKIDPSIYKPIETGTNLKLDKNNMLIGNFGKTLDLRDVELNFEIIVNSKDDLARAKEAKRPPPSPIYICDNTEVEVLYLPLDRAMVAYAVIENLPNLRELFITGDNALGLPSNDLKWLICLNLPKLTKITAEGRLVWLQIENVPMLETIDVQACPNLDYFSILGAPTINKINVGGCKKLEKVDGIPDGSQVSLDVQKQINAIQDKSKRNGSIYKNMTFTDVLDVLSRINVGMKLALKQNYLLGEVEAIVLARNRDSDVPYHFGLELLRPLEVVTTGGSGDTFAYRTVYEGCEIGNDSQEDCLDYLLCFIVRNFEFDVAGKSCSDKKSVLTLLNKLVTDAAHSIGKSKPKKEKKVDFAKLDGMGIAELLSVSPNLILECDLKKLNPNHWIYLLIDQPQLASKCNFKKLNGQNLSSLLSRQPQLEKKCDLSKLDSGNWVTLICQRPEFSDKCDFSKFSGDNWCDLLSERPEFVNQCNFNLLDGSSWASLLASQPQLSIKCAFEKLSGQDWSYLLIKTLEFVDQCDFKKFERGDWERLIQYRPQFSEIYSANGK